MTTTHNSLQESAPQEVPQWALNAAQDIQDDPGLLVKQHARIIAQHAATLTAENERLKQENTQYRNGFFPETAALHAILGAAGCVSVRKKDYEEMKNQITALREWVERAREILKSSLDALIDAERILKDAVSESKAGAARSPDGYYLDAARMVANAQERCERFLASTPPAPGADGQEGKQ